MATPTRISKIVPYYTQHAAIFKATPAAFGLSVGQATNFDNAAKALSAAFDAANTAREASKGATAVQTAALNTANQTFGTCVEIIRAFANASANPAAVYSASQIDPPSPPSPVGPPSAVESIGASIDINSGAVVLTWKAKNPGSNGISYIIKRKLPAATAFTFLGIAPGGGTGGKKFTDTTLPAGSDYVSYSIQGTRAGLSGPTVNVTVNFGVAGNGQFAVENVKLAA